MTDDLDPDTWRPPKCSHGFIILGCPDDDCPEQSEYLNSQSAVMERWWDDQAAAARAAVRELMGLDPDSDS